MLRLIPILLFLASPVLATETTDAAVDSEAATAATDAKAKNDRRKAADCDQTGTRIKGGNRSQPMRCYSREDLAKTGATDLGDALRRLDPSIR